MGTGVGPRNHVLDRQGQDLPAGSEALLAVIFGHAQSCLRSIFSTLFARGSSDAASGYQSTIATCCVWYTDSNDGPAWSGTPTDPVVAVSNL